MSSKSISVIIPTYNVKGFITFCIDSVLRSTIANEIEIIVVDNNSADGSSDFIKSNYPKVTVISNHANEGFSKACNKGALKATGSQLVFLNPDCIVAEDTIEVLVSHAAKADIGMVGPLLIDGSGRPLPESAREQPTTMGGVNKMFRLPFEKEYPYYKKISVNTVVEAPVLTGACFSISASLYRSLGGFDERFFMYGEDVDLSVRTLKSGHKNICDTSAKVIHFKGESTDKKQLTYNYHFYNAVKLFLEKHSKDGGITKKGVGVLASAASTLKFAYHRLKNLIPGLVDFIIIFLSLWAVQFFWSFLKIGDLNYYGPYQYVFRYLIYALVWTVTLYFSGVYFKSELSLSKVFRANFVGGLSVLILYALLPEDLRFSRMLIVISILLVPCLITLKYSILNKITKRGEFIISDNKKQVAVSSYIDEKIKTVDLQSYKDDNSRHGGSVYIDFSSVVIKELINLMLSIGQKTTYIFWDSKRDLIFSSSSSSKPGASSLSISHYHLEQSAFQLQKRFIDVFASLLFIIPIIIVKLFRWKTQLTPLKYLLIGRATLFGYAESDMQSEVLPYLKPCLVTCYESQDSKAKKVSNARDYSANYTIFDDVFLIIAKFTTIVKAIMGSNIEDERSY